jgi:hypothetical protein
MSFASLLMVQKVILPATSGLPNLLENLARISSAAALVWVMHTMDSGAMPRSRARYPRRATSTVVFPLPGTATRSVAPSTTCAARSCWRLSSMP